MIIVDGKKIANNMLAEIAGEVRELKQPLNLASVLIGDINNARKFLEIKQKAAKKVGIGFKLYEFPETIGQEALMEEIKKIAEDDKNHGVIIELPLPKHLAPRKLLDLIPHEKDPDILSSAAQDLFYSNKSSVLPPAVEAVKKIFLEYNIDLKNKKIAVFGYGILVGKPIAHWLEKQGAKVSIIDELTPKPETISRNVDMVISGVGHANLIIPDMVKAGVIAIDFGFNSTTPGATTPGVTGDISQDIAEKAFLFTPVPGGVGPIVVASVLKNLITLTQNDKN